MKKILFGALLLSAATLSAQAQISAGTKLLTGSINYNQGKSEDNSTGTYNQASERKAKSFFFNPSVGYFVADNLALGVEGGLSLGRSTTDRSYNVPVGGGFAGQFSREESEERTRTLSGGLFGRYYKFLGEKVALYGQLGGGYQNTYSSRQILSQNVPFCSSGRQEGVYANLLPGVVFFPTNKLGLELQLQGISYSRLTEKNSGNSSVFNYTSSNFNFGFGLSSLRLGISLYLGRN
ncbi:outer membrane beta-barrel protein [Hymenobacter aerophilus]|uniref:outer membrane beta-barrel protein n=1 Tax=Hymenobacter aerophilus TaxID=119644 RepID=UPI000369465A|nr:outer membrane beta-barrel protein [Hymenobacter aerophilus]